MWLEQKIYLNLNVFLKNPRDSLKIAFYSDDVVDEKSRTLNQAYFLLFICLNVLIVHLCKVFNN